MTVRRTPIALVIAVLGATTLSLQAPLRADQHSRPFKADFQGVYQVRFGAGSNGNHALTFQGSGNASHMGNTAIDGKSEMAPGSQPHCTSIENDWVVLKAEGGDEIWQVNSGEDCMEITSSGLVIKGTGKMTIVGGTGRFASARGIGTWVVSAPVTQAGPTGAEGTFVLGFSGTISY